MARRMHVRELRALCALYDLTNLTNRAAFPPLWVDSVTTCIYSIKIANNVCHRRVATTHTFTHNRVQFSCEPFCISDHFLVFLLLLRDAVFIFNLFSRLKRAKEIKMTFRMETSHFGTLFVNTYVIY